MKIIKKIISLLLVFMLVGCSTSKGTVRSYNTYTVYPIGYLLNRIGGNKITSVSIQSSDIVQNATIIDEYEDTLSKTINFYHIANLEPYIDLYHDEITNSGVNDIDLSSSSIYEFKRYTPVIINGSYSFVESDYYEGSAFDYTDVISNDYYIWLDPIGMLSMANAVYANLSNNYAEEASYFKTNYDSLESDLISLDAAYQNFATSLQTDNKSVKFVSMSPSFGSWQKAYGIQVYPVCLSKFGALPTDSQLQIIKERIVADGVEYIAYEPNMSSEMLELFNSLEEELGLKRVNLSNLSSLTVTQQTDSKDYLSIMYENLSVLESMATNSTVETTTEETTESSE